MGGLKRHVRAAANASTNSAMTLACFQRFRFAFAADADLFQEWIDRLFAAEEFFDRDIHVARITLLIDFLAQAHARVFVEITVFCLLKHCRHVGGDGIGPGVAVIAGTGAKSYIDKLIAGIEPKFAAEVSTLQKMKAAETNDPVAEKLKWGASASEREMTATCKFFKRKALVDWETEDCVEGLCGKAKSRRTFL